MLNNMTILLTFTSYISNYNLLLRKRFVSDDFIKKAVNAILNYNSFSLMGNGRDCIAVNHAEKTENWV